MPNSQLGHSHFSPHYSTYLPKTVGRFAPSPTGQLHLGSLLTAVASFCLAKQHQDSQWLVRIEDVDTERCKPEFATSILRDLERLGLHWDGEVRYQSEHLATYHEFLDSKLFPVSYGCDCTRKSLQAFWQNSSINYIKNSTQPYPQLCVHKNLSREHAIRVIMPNQTMIFYDQLQGVIKANPQRESGDIIVRRRATNEPLGMINYMLACVVDDAIQGVNQVVRGLDILPLTIPQLVIADYLKLPLVKSYYHLPILVNEQGQKLSKQTLATPISDFSPESLLTLVLKLLGQPPVDIDKPTVMLQQAMTQWDNQPLIAKQQLFAPDLNFLT